jgi:hypothetical protein
VLPLIRAAANRGLKKVLTTRGVSAHRCATPHPPIRGRGRRQFPHKLSLDGKLLGESGKQLKQFGWIHEIACPSENVLYVGELLNWRVQKLMLHP